MSGHPRFGAPLGEVPARLATRRTTRITFGAMVFVATVSMSTGCGPGRSDSVATNTADVGDWQVHSTETGKTVTADVCIDKAGSADEIAARIVQQLANHSYDTITLDLYSHERSLARYRSTHAGIERQPLPAQTNQCLPSSGRSQPGQSSNDQPPK